MAVNRFSTPVDSQYISQYVPIPFQELYAIGKEYNTQRQQAEKQLSDYVQKWSEFESPSAVDTQRWYDITMKPAIKVAEQYARNPELLKTPEGRSSIYNLINSLPYEELSALKSSRNNMLKRQEMNMKLAAEGKYNPLWHDVDFTNYDTLSSSGIFNDLSPLAYKSEVDLVKPYVDNLKDSYLYSQGGYDYFGVSPDDTDEQVHDNISAIYNTPEAQMHIKALMKQGLSEKDAKDTFERSIYLAGREFARVNRQANPYSVLEYENTLKAKQKQPNIQLGQEDVLSKDFDIKKQSIIDSVMVDSNGNPSAISQKYSNLFKANAEEINKVISTMEQSSPEFSKAFNEGISLLKDQNITGNTAISLALQNALALTKDKIDPALIKQLNSLNARSNQMVNDMTDEAYGEYYSRSFNTILGKSITENPFSSLKNETGNGKFFSDTKGQHMWSMTLLDTMQEISSSTEGEINKELFKSETPKNEKGFLISPSMLLSPKNFIFNSNKHLQKLAKDVDFDVQGSMLDRYSGIMHDGDSNLSLEERVASGEFGKVRVQRVVGYVDTPENRNYVVEVSLPMDEDDSALGKRMTAWWRWDDIEGAIEDAGYQVVPREDGGKDLVLTMVIPESNKSVDKRRRNAKYQKEYGTSETKEIQSVLDNEALKNIKNYSIQYGYKK